MPRERVVTIWWDNEQKRIAVRFPYDKELVEKLKFFVHKSFRSFSGPPRNIWFVDMQCEAELKEAIRGAGYEVQSVESVVATNHSAFHRLIAEAGIETLRRVYYIVAQAAHPDRGGSDEWMQRVNLAWGEIQREKGGK